jgi:Flagellar protein YcgR/PilZ domain
MADSQHYRQSLSCRQPHMTALPKNLRRSTLEGLIRDYADFGARSRMGLVISPGDSKVSYTVSVVGVISAKRQLILNAPVNEDGSLIAVMKGQSLSCKWINASTMFQFRVLISRILFDPVPLLHVDLPSQVERRTLRGVPRALCHLRAIIQTPEEQEAAIVDISTGGARIAVHEQTRLSVDQNVVLLARPILLNREFQISLYCRVTGPVTPLDPKHPQIRFYGINFDHLSDNELLILHAYVQECLLLETDGLSQALLLNSKETDGAPN